MQIGACITDSRGNGANERVAVLGNVLVRLAPSFRGIVLVAIISCREACAREADRGA